MAGILSYEPNSYEEWKDQPNFAEPPLSIEGAADHWNHRVDDDYYSQPGNLFRLLGREERQRLFDNTARALGNAEKKVKDRHIANCTKADAAYGAGVEEALSRFNSDADAFTATSHVANTVLR